MKGAQTVPPAEISCIFDEKKTASIRVGPIHYEVRCEARVKCGKRARTHIEGINKVGHSIWHRDYCDRQRKSRGWIPITTAISAAEGDIGTASDGFSDNTRLFIPATQFNRFAITREINDGLLAPRFAPSQKGWVMSVSLVSVSPSVPASQDEDADDR